MLGKGEFRRLLQWRNKMSTAWKSEQKAAAKAARGEGEEAEGEEGEEGAEDKEDEELGELERLARQREKGAKRRKSEAAAKFKERLLLKMEHPGDRLDIQAPHLPSDPTRTPPPSAPGPSPRPPERDRMPMLRPYVRAGGV